jgi:hypothetical protein
MMASGIKPWTRQLELCGAWLKIIFDELALRGDELTPEEAGQLSAQASAIYTQAQMVSQSLDKIARTSGQAQGFSF